MKKLISNSMTSLVALISIELFYISFLPLFHSTHAYSATVSTVETRLDSKNKLSSNAWSSFLADLKLDSNQNGYYEKLLKDAMKKVGAKDLESLRERIHLVSRKEMKGDGETLHGSMKVLKADLVRVTKDNSFEQNNIKKGVRAELKRQGGDQVLVQKLGQGNWLYLLYTKSQASTIRIDRNTSWQNQKALLLHELIHLAHSRPLSVLPDIAIRSKENYFEWESGVDTTTTGLKVRMGSEMDSYIREYQYRIKNRMSVPSKVKKYFTKNGVFISNNVSIQALSKHILHDKGYAQDFEHHYETALANDLSITETRLSLLKNERQTKILDSESLILLVAEIRKQELRKSSLIKSQKTVAQQNKSRIERFTISSYDFNSATADCLK